MAEPTPEVVAEAASLSADFVNMGREAVAKELGPLLDYAARAGKAEISAVAQAIQAVTEKLLVHVVGALHPTGLDAVVTAMVHKQAAEADAQIAADATNETVATHDAPTPVVEAVEAVVDPALESLNAEMAALAGIAKQGA